MVNLKINLDSKTKINKFKSKKIPKGMKYKKILKNLLKKRKKISKMPRLKLKKSYNLTINRIPASLLKIYNKSLK